MTRHRLLVLAALMIAPAVHADRITLTDGTELSGAVLDKDATHVIVRVDRGEPSDMMDVRARIKRSAIATINGAPMPPPVAAGSPAPDFSVTDLEGKTRSLAKSKGVKLVQFWATWCPHCRSDVQLMKDIAAKYQSKGFEMFSLSIDEDVGKLKAFVKAEQISYPVAALAEQFDPQAAAEIPERYESRGVPAYYLIGKDNVILRKFSGSLVEGKIEFEQVLKDALDGKPGPKS